MVYNLLAAEADFSLNQALAQAAALQPIDIAPSALADAHAFVERRLQGVLLEMGFAHDVVEAVVAVRGDNPFAALQACRIHSRRGGTPLVDAAFTAYARCARMCATWTNLCPWPRLPTPRKWNGICTPRAWPPPTLAAAPDAADALGDVLRDLQAPIDRFFTEVLVNADDPAVRAARQALIQHIARLPESVADLSKLQGF